MPSTATKTINIKEALTVGWQSWKRNFLFFIGVMVLVYLIPAIPVLIQGLVGGFIVELFLLGTALILRRLIWLGLIKIALLVSANQPARLGYLFNQSAKLIKFAVANLIVSLITIVGYLLLIVPGVIWALKYQLVPFLIADKGLGPIAALRQSARLTQGAKLQLFYLLLATTLINFVGALALGLGLFITVPLTIVAQAHVYRQLLAQEESA